MTPFFMQGRCSLKVEHLDDQSRGCAGQRTILDDNLDGFDSALLAPLNLEIRRP